MDDDIFEKARKQGEGTKMQFRGNEWWGEVAMWAFYILGPIALYVWLTRNHGG